MSSRAQSTNTDYELHTLGWKSFQDLCISLTREIFGQTVQIFNSSKDGGRDGAFYGVWDPADQKSELSGSFTFQCKFISSPHKILQSSHIEDEYDKAKILAGKGLCDNYILLTNYSISALSEATIRARFLSIHGIKEFRLFGKEWISQQIRESTRLRMHVPRIYGLGDLSQILDERVYEQAKEIIFSMKNTLSKFVVTEPYRKSVDALLEHGIVVLIGEAASGKSTIAASLSVAAADQWKTLAIKIVEPSDFKRHWNPNENRQFFWIDDAFGATQFQKNRTQEWNHLFPLMAAAVKNGARIVMTSRDYIFKAAFQVLKISEFPLLGISQVVIQVQELSKNEREQILYNHIKLGNQPRLVKTQLKPHLPSIATNNSFTPEMARRLGSAQFTRQLSIDKDALIEFISKPMEFLKEIIRTLDPESRAVLGLIFMRGGRMSVSFTLTDKEKEVVEIMSASIQGVRDALRALEGSFIQIIKSEGSAYWVFTHPTIADAYSSLISSDAQLLDVYLEKTPIDKLIYEISCGEVELQGHKVIVPHDKYPVIAKRLGELKDRGQWISFLSYRCDKSFLQNHFIRPEIKESIVRVYSYFHACGELSLLSRLHQFGLLPEEWRVECVSKISDLAIETPDGDFLSLDRIRGLLTAAEIETIMVRVRTELMPIIDDVIYNWKNSCPDNQAGSYFEPLESSLRDFKEYFKSEEDVVQEFQSALDAVTDVKEEMIKQTDQDLDDDPSLYSSSALAESLQERDIFDDVDGD